MLKNQLTLEKDILPLIKLAAPLALTGLVNSAVWFFETIFLAHLGIEKLAAGALVSWLFGTMIVILFGALSSINILVAYKHGANDQTGIAEVARDGLVLAFLLTIPTFIIFWNMAEIFAWLGQSPEVVEPARAYLHALSFGILPEFMTMALLEVIIGLGRAKAILWFTICSVTLNIFCSYVLIFGKFGFNAYGIAGAGLGMTVSYWLSIFILMTFIISNKNYRIYFRNVFSLKMPKYLRELLQIGIPVGFMYCVEVAFFFALTLLMGVLGIMSQAANQVVIQYVGLFMSMMFAIAQAVTVRIGHLLGAKEVSSAAYASHIGVGIALILMCIVAACYWLFPNALINIAFDIHNPNNFEMISEIKSLLYIAALFQIVEAIRIILFGSLRGLKDTKFTLLISIISFWGIALPIGYFLAIPMNIGSRGFWWAMLSSATVSMILLQWRFNKRMRHISSFDKGKASIKAF